MTRIRKILIGANYTLGATLIGLCGMFIYEKRQEDKRKQMANDYADFHYLKYTDPYTNECKNMTWPEYRNKKKLERRWWS